MEWIFSRPVVVTLALTGGLFSLVAMWLRKRPTMPERSSPDWAVIWAARLDAISYGFMGVSMLLFIIAGLRGPQN